MALPPTLIRGSQRIYEAVIGLEIHAAVLSNTKLFSSAPSYAVSNTSGASANAAICMFDAALPGTLPRGNVAAVAAAARTGLALGGQVEPVVAWDRKHYTYADLPHGYQVTQLAAPIVTGGQLALRLAAGSNSDTSQYTRTVRLERIQLEMDSGKSLHTAAVDKTLVDLNRAGNPLMEIVTAPDLRTAEEAGAFIRKLQHLLRYIETSDGNMEAGSLRADVNVSLREWGAADYGERVEMKNLNSIRAVERSVAHEIERQAQLLDTVPLIAPRAPDEPVPTMASWASELVPKETRTFNGSSGMTVRLRGKEDELDYRFLPEPDLRPLHLHAGWVAAQQAALPELPDALRARYMSVLELPAYDADVLAGEMSAPAYFEAMVQCMQAGALAAGATVVPGGMALAPAAKQAAAWLCNELFGALARAGWSIDTCPLPASAAADILLLVQAEVISGRVAKALLEEMLRARGWLPAEEALQVLGHPAEPRTPSRPDSAMEIVQAKGWQQLTDPAVLAALADAVVQEDMGGPSIADAVATWPAHMRDALQAGSDASSSRKKSKKSSNKSASAVARYLEGNERMASALVGKMMAASGGRAAPAASHSAIIERLERERPGT